MYKCLRHWDTSKKELKLLSYYHCHVIMVVKVIYHLKIIHTSFLHIKVTFTYTIFTLVSEISTPGTFFNFLLNLDEACSYVTIPAQ